MIQELLYTSHAGEGLRKGSGRGYCTVLSTQGMALNLANALEKLSAYKHPFDLHDSRSESNPVNYRHMKVRMGGVTCHILSRISDMRQEHTGRTNKLAHHVVLPGTLLPLGGPSWVLSHPGLCRESWDGKVRLVPEMSEKRLPSTDMESGVCCRWESATGDAGWAGHVAQHLVDMPNDPLTVIFPLGSDTLLLVNEILRLIPAPRRWDISFSTYFNTLPPGTTCHLRWMLDGTPEADQIRRDYRRKVIDLTTRLGAAPDSEYATAARTGRLTSSAPPPLPLKPPEISTRVAAGHDVVAQPSLDELGVELGPPEVRGAEFDFHFHNEPVSTRIRPLKRKRSSNSGNVFTSPGALAGLFLAGVLVATIVAYLMATARSSSSNGNSNSNSHSNTETSDEKKAAPTAAEPGTESNGGERSATDQTENKTQRPDAVAHDKGAAGARSDVRSVGASNAPLATPARDASSHSGSDGLVPTHEEAAASMTVESFMLPPIQRSGNASAPKEVVLASHVDLDGTREVTLEIVGLEHLAVAAGEQSEFRVERDLVVESPAWVVKEYRKASIGPEVGVDVARVVLKERQLRFAWGPKASGHARVVDGLRWCVLKIRPMGDPTMYVPLTLPLTSQRDVDVTSRSHDTKTPHVVRREFVIALDGEVLPSREWLVAYVTPASRTTQMKDWNCQILPDGDGCLLELATEDRSAQKDAPKPKIRVEWKSRVLTSAGAKGEEEERLQEERQPNASGHVIGHSTVLLVQVDLTLDEDSRLRNDLTRVIPKTPFALSVTLCANYNARNMDRGDTTQAASEEVIPEVHIIDNVPLQVDLTEVIH